MLIERVNKIYFLKKETESEDDLFKDAATQLSLLLKNNYSCFISTTEKPEGLCIEYSPMNAELKKDLPLACWLYPDELEYLSKYQVDTMLQDMQNFAEDVKAELDNNADDTKDEDNKTDKDKFDA